MNFFCSAHFLLYRDTYLKEHPKLELVSDPGFKKPGTARGDFLIAPAGAWFLFLVQLGMWF